MQQHSEVLEKLAFSNILLTAVIESSPDGILVANNINKILTYNQRFLEIWDISPEDEASGINEKLLMRKAQALKDPERYVENIRLQHANSNKDSRYETEFKDGRVFEERPPCCAIKTIISAASGSTMRSQKLDRQPRR